ncbi:MAG: hypothetical protein OXH09_15805 [Gammaproteobacteria bacterium]|nr:hypothetical protein [Gammaproteobacteria bacterium]
MGAAFVALGGVGGIVAALNYYSANRDLISLYATMNSDSLYKIEQDNSRSRIAIMPLEDLARELQQRPSSPAAVADLTFEITNLGSRPISAHDLTLELDITPLVSRRLIVVSKGDALTEEELTSHDLNVKVVQTQGRILTLEVLGTDPLAHTIDRLQSALEGRIDHVAPDVPGTTHSEPFLSTEIVTHVLSPETHRYGISVDHQVTPKDTVRVPVQFGAATSIEGAGRILLRYNSTSDIVLTQHFTIQITPAPQSRVTTE